MMGAGEGRPAQRPVSININSARRTHRDGIPIFAIEKRKRSHAFVQRDPPIKSATCQATSEHADAALVTGEESEMGRRKFFSGVWLDLDRALRDRSSWISR